MARRDTLDNGLSESKGESAQIPKAPNGGWGWLVVMSSFMHNCLIDSVSFTFGIFYDDIIKTFNEGSAKTQLLNSVVVGVALLIGPLTGALINSFDCRRVAMAGGVFSLVGLFFSTFSPNLEVMILLYGVVGGIGIGLIYTPSVVIVSYYFDKRRALATGIATCGSGIGSFVFSPVYEFLVETYGWKGAMWIVSAILFNCVLFAMIYRPLPTQENCPSQDAANDDKVTICDTEVTVETPLSQLVVKLQTFVKSLNLPLLTNVSFILFLLSGSFAAMGSQVPYNLLPASALDKGFSDSDGAFLISILGIASTVSMVLSGLMADYPWVDSILFYSGWLVIGGVATCFLPYYNDYSSLVVYCVVLGLVLGMNISLTSIIILEFISLDKLSSALGLLTFFLGISTIIGPPIAGVLVDMTGGYSDAFYFAGATFILSGITCFPIRFTVKCNKCTSDSHVTSVDLPVVEITHM